jgi:hypothetical protein
MNSLIRILVVTIVIASGAASSGENIDYSVPGIVFTLKQPKSMDCWATAATMLVSWKETTLLGIKDVVARAGTEYVTAFDQNSGLSKTQKPGFIQALKMKAEAPQNYTVKGWRDLLKSYGLLWVTTVEGGVHARIMTKISGDGSVKGTHVVFIDPATGKSATETIEDFISKFEELAKSECQTCELRPQVVHF